MIVIAMMMAATIQPNAIHAPPSTIHRTFRSSETGDMALLYLAGDAIEIGKAAAGLTRSSVQGRNPIAADRSGGKLLPTTIEIASVHGENHSCVRSNSAGIYPRTATP